MLKGNIKKNLGVFIKNKSNDLFGFLGTNTWVFTVLFFGAVLIASVWIWWQCVYQPKPSIAVMKKIETEKEDFDNMKKETLEAITFLQECRDNYNNSDKFGDQRELFVDVLDENVVEKLNEIESAKIEKENETGATDNNEEIKIEEKQPQKVVGNEEDNIPTEIIEDVTPNNNF